MLLHLKKCFHFLPSSITISLLCIGLITATCFGLFCKPSSDSTIRTKGKCVHRETLLSASSQMYINNVFLFRCCSNWRQWPIEKAETCSSYYTLQRYYARCDKIETFLEEFRGSSKTPQVSNGFPQIATNLRFWNTFLGWRNRPYWSTPYSKFLPQTSLQAPEGSNASQAKDITGKW